jgi:hypothetical protein
LLCFFLCFVARPPERRTLNLRPLCPDAAAYG